MNRLQTFTIYFFLGAIVVMSTQALPLVYDYLNFSEVQIASLVSASLFAAVFQPLFGYLTDKFLSPLLSLKLSMLLMSLLSFIMFFYNQFAIMYILVFIFFIFRISLFPLYDSYISGIISKHGGNYGLVRSGASLGFGLGISLLTIFLTIFNLSTNYALLFIIILCMINLVLFIFINEEDKLPEQEYSNSNQNKTNYKIYILLVIYNILYLGFINLRLSYQATYFLEFDYSQQIISIATFLMIVPEFLLLPFYSKFYKNFRYSTIFLIVTTIAVIQVLLLIFVHDNLFILLFVTMLHGLQNSAFLPANVLAMRSSLSDKNAATGFIINSALFSILIGIVNQFFIAPLYQESKSTIIIYWIILFFVFLSYIPILILKTTKWDKMI